MQARGEAPVSLLLLSLSDSAQHAVKLILHLLEGHLALRVPLDDLHFGFAQRLDFLLLLVSLPE